MPKLTLEEVQKKIKPIAEKYQMKRVWVFGSTARGENDENSDLDLIIERGYALNGKNLFNEFDFLDEVEETFGVEVDRISESALRLPQNQEVSSIFISVLDKEKKLVYG